jgi:hypothetical protein
MLDEKSKGQDFTVAAPEASQRAQIIDLMHALKQSIEKAKPKQKAAPAQRKRKNRFVDLHVALTQRPQPAPSNSRYGNLLPRHSRFA